VRLLYTSGYLEEILSLLHFKVFVILYSRNCRSLIWYAMIQEWFLWHGWRHIAQDAITSTYVSRNDTINNIMKIFIQSNVKDYRTFQPPLLCTYYWCLGVTSSPTYVLILKFQKIEINSKIMKYPHMYCSYIQNYYNFMDLQSFSPYILKMCLLEALKSLNASNFLT
jgi:hypothetical protein